MTNRVSLDGLEVEEYDDGIYLKHNDQSVRLRVFPS